MCLNTKSNTVIGSAVLQGPKAYMQLSALLGLMFVIITSMFVKDIIFVSLQIFFVGYKNVGYVSPIYCIL